MEKANRKSGTFLVILALSFMITAVSYVLGVNMYRNNIRGNHYDYVHVQLTDFIENIRFSLHFGKDLQTFYKMNNLLLEQIQKNQNIDGLYVATGSGDVLFATDGRELPAEVLKLVDNFYIDGERFYSIMPLDENTGAKLISRCDSRHILLKESEHMIRFLVLSIIGYIIFALVTGLLWAFFPKRSHITHLMMTVLFFWIAIISAVAFTGVYKEYSENTEVTKTSIEECVLHDINMIRDMGVADSSIKQPLDSYFSRYPDEIKSIESVTMDENGNILVAIRPYFRTFVFRFLIQMAFFFIISSVILSIFERLTSPEAEEGGAGE
ncbi:MAG: hypothetical protein IKR68_02370 [Lachnospiraceae bacterium]|nr:hypothetical protein [Lachnospiraceae bacterium]